MMLKFITTFNFNESVAVKGINEKKASQLFIAAVAIKTTLEMNGYDPEEVSAILAIAQDLMFEDDQPVSISNDVLKAIIDSFSDDEEEAEN